ncbi:E3 ubiquitin-protein ligase MARCH5 isoform X4 [Ostrinia furnacalis]|uniref:E3 ubiquitin-protein ligase MARCH5 isoform X1 n=1 Tax=Ostrinia furnacalis TaxID=93504 RepID=UPI00103A6083|nr:E3 ubiquitin-protein ligase MARCH5 isoform X1 [Ostrinia furnacalis]XP_028167420.1 E3 ubiquitin-protein ligase MARCH5 isoform X2 [Ostrinia furnacalis]XP_028167421.1 E3 ubiquitin-protein ligase MARCH5 isoform X3 [Ostrinia furnacalis]XP_028167422.1 E3 ubiquitin-protein ligase MARCH5 isoform X4 [Ostrinia furnacalis]
MSSEKPSGNNGTSEGSSQALQSADDENLKSCWVCFATEADDRLAAWVQPCKCIGTTKWVHQSCLQRWVDEKQRGNITRKVLCPQCKAEYIVVFPSMGAFVALLDAMEEITHKICPFIAGGVLLGSIYWIAITYGAVTVMQVVGHREGLEMMESADPLVLLVLLPTIPVTLISAKMYNWEDSVLLFLRKYCAKVPALSYILPFGNVEGDRGAVVPGQPNNQNPNASSHLSPTRIFCSALLLPTISTIIGKIFFRSIQNNLHRTILGGLTYITIKGALKIYHKQMLYIRHSSRKILDYTESNLKLYRSNTTTDAVSSTRDDSEQVV